MRAFILTLAALAAAGLAAGCQTGQQTAEAPMSNSSSPALSTTDPSPEIACRLSPQQLAERRAQLIPGLMSRAEQVSDIPNGLRLRFAHRPGLVPDLAKVIEQEQDCCSFLRFHLTTEPSAGPVTLDISGPPGTAEVLRQL